MGENVGKYGICINAVGCEKRYPMGVLSSSVKAWKVTGSATSGAPTSAHPVAEKCIPLISGNGAFTADRERQFAMSCYFHLITSRT